MAECKISKCDCKNEFQDSLYGKQMRIFNPLGKGSSQGDKYKCTVCGKEISNFKINKK